MEGQTGIEFIVSIIVFLTTITYASLTVIDNMPVYHDYAEKEDLISTSYQLSEYLLFERLSREEYVLEQDKVNSLQGYCNTPSNIMAEFDFDSSRDFMINITTINGESIFYCSTIDSIVSREFIVRRFAMYENDVAIMNVAVV